jgi:hypothetical protein
MVSPADDIFTFGVVDRALVRRTRGWEVLGGAIKRAAGHRPEQARRWTDAYGTEGKYRLERVIGKRK